MNPCPEWIRRFLRSRITDPDLDHPPKKAPFKLHYCARVEKKKIYQGLKCHLDMLPN